MPAYCHNATDSRLLKQTKASAVKAFAVAIGLVAAVGSVSAQNSPGYGSGGYSGGGNSQSPSYDNTAPPLRDYPNQGPSGPGPRRNSDDAYRPQARGADQSYGQSYGTTTPSDAYSSGRGGYASNQGPNSGSSGYSGQYSGPNSGQGGFGQPYTPPSDDADRDYARSPADQNYGPGPRRYDDRPADGTYSTSEITDAGRGFFGSVSKGLASVIEHAFKRQGRPNGYILGEEAGGAFVAGLRYGEGTLYTRDAGTHKVYWQGPSLGYDFGGEGSKVMVLVYNMRDPRDIFDRFGGVDGSAYLVGGVGITFLARDHMTLAPIRSGVGLRLGANVGYLKYTPRPTWNPF
jgi:hypothetical protein